eukprot:PhM_4_TR283/c0_g1_i1/m.80573
MDFLLDIPTPMEKDERREVAEVEDKMLSAVHAFQTSLAISGYASLRALPFRDLESLTRLRTLTISYNLSMSTIPPQIENLISLESLTITYTAVKDIPASVCRLRYLTSLDVSCNEIEFLPSAIERLKSLTRLNCERNKIAALPLELGNILGLREIVCEGNQGFITRAETTATTPSPSYASVLKRLKDTYPIHDDFGAKCGACSAPISATPGIGKHTLYSVAVRCLNVANARDLPMMSLLCSDRCEKQFHGVPS